MSRPTTFKFHWKRVPEKPSVPVCETSPPSNWMQLVEPPCLKHLSLDPHWFLPWSAVGDTSTFPRLWFGSPLYPFLIWKFSNRTKGLLLLWFLHVLSNTSPCLRALRSYVSFFVRELFGEGTLNSYLLEWVISLSIFVSSKFLHYSIMHTIWTSIPSPPVILIGSVLSYRFLATFS